MAASRRLRKRKHLSYSPFVRFLVRPASYFLFKLLFRTSTDNKDATRFPAPYVLLLQHSSAIDSVVYHSFIRSPIHYVVSDAHFRHPAMRFLMHLVGAIEKKKSMHDLRSAVEMMYVLTSLKETVGIFPEGFNTWDGVSVSPIRSTAKLIKRAQLPVICARSHGAYSSFPRWARGMRRGRWKLMFSVCLSPHHIATMSEDEIYEHFSRALENNEFEHQVKNPIAFSSPRRAEYIERVLFICPLCECFQSIYSHKTSFSCKTCLSLWYINAYGFFSLRDVPSSHHRNFRTLAEWDKWQIEYLERFLHTKIPNTEKTIFYDADTTLAYGKRRPATQCGRGSLTLTTKELIFTPKKNVPPRSFAFPSIGRLNVQNNEKLEWTTPNNITYQLRSKSPRGNTYKYLRALQIIRTKHSR